jgi:hypothetical protein
MIAIVCCLVLWITSRNNPFMLCSYDCEEVVRVHYGISSADRNHESREPADLQTHAGATILRALHAAGVSGLAAHQGVLLAVFGLTLVYAYVAAAELASGTLALLFVVLAATSYPHVLGSALNPVTVWNSFALWGFLVHTYSFARKGGAARCFIAFGFGLLTAGCGIGSVWAAMAFLAALFWCNPESGRERPRLLLSGVGLMCAIILAPVVFSNDLFAPALGRAFAGIVRQFSAGSVAQIAAALPRISSEIGVISLLLAAWLGARASVAGVRAWLATALRPEWQSAAAGVGMGLCFVPAAVVFGRLAGIDGPLYKRIAIFAPWAIGGAIWLQALRWGRRSSAGPLPELGSDSWLRPRLGFLLPLPFLMFFALAVLAQRSAVSASGIALWPQVYLVCALALLLLLFCAAAAVVPRLAGWFSISIGSAEPKQDWPFTGRIFLAVLLAGGIAQWLGQADSQGPTTTLLTPLLVQAIVFIKASLVVGLFRGALAMSGPPRAFRLLAVVLLVGDHIGVQAASWIQRRAPDFTWIPFVKEHDRDLIAISWIPHSVGVFGSGRTVGVRAGLEPVMAERVARRAPVFKPAEVVTLPAGTLSFQQPDYWIYLRTGDREQAGCRQDYLVRFAAKLTGRISGAPAVRHIEVQPNAGWPGGSIYVQVEFDSTSDEVESVAVLAGGLEPPEQTPAMPLEPGADAPALGQLRWDCATGSAYGTVALPPAPSGVRLPYRLTLPLRLQYRNGTGRVVRGISVLVDSVGGSEPQVTVPPQPNPLAFQAGMSSLPCVSCTHHHAIFDLRAYNRQNPAAATQKGDPRP